MKKIEVLPFPGDNLSFNVPAHVGLRVWYRVRIQPSRLICFRVCNSVYINIKKLIR